MKSVALISRSLQAVYITINFIWYLQKVSTFFFLTGMYCTENIGKQSKSKQRERKPQSVYFDLFLEKYFSTQILDF